MKLIEIIARSGDLFGAIESERLKDVLSTSDEDAIKGDWQVVGDDIRDAAREYKRNQRANNGRRSEQPAFS